ncbi:signal peptidase [Chryseobacterium sp. 2R14A]|uniref:signal peptidase n=1 Tax=Chryseobacterium sp. 2R14A TaxID=3380353 RepID=UPI003CF131A5
MMRIFNEKLLLLLFVVFSSLISAQSNGPGGGPPCGTPITGPCPAATSPIDMYVYILAAVAILGIGFFATKYRTQKI